MSYKFETDKIKLSETQDRRKKLTESQKQEIRELYSTGHFSLNQLAKQFEISKKSILLIVNPESNEKAKEYRKENWKRWQRTGEERNKAVREHRRYKQQLYKEGKLK